MKPKISSQIKWPQGKAQSKESEITETRMREALRLVLIGKTGSGKSASGNTILGQRHFESRLDPSSVTRTSSIGTVDLGEEANVKRVVVVDTPGFGDTHLSEDEVHSRVSECVALSAPGPHAFMLVVPLGRYTEDEDRAVDQLTQIFGDEALHHHTLILFTRGDELEGTVEDFLKRAPPKLQALIDRCGRRYHVFNNKDTSGSVQVRELIRKVETMAKQTATEFYTSELYQGAMAAIREEQQSLLRRRRPRGEDQKVSSSSSSIREKQTRLASSSSRPSELQSWLEAALSPDVLKKIKIMVAAVAAGVAIGAVVGLAVPLAAAGGASLVGNSVCVATSLLSGQAAAAAGTAVSAVVTAASGATALKVGAATGAVVGGMVGAVAATEADSPSEATKNTMKQVAQVGVAAVGVAAVAGGVLGAGVAISAASGVAAGAANAAAQTGAPALMQGAANAAAQTGAPALMQGAANAATQTGAPALMQSAANAAAETGAPALMQGAANAAAGTSNANNIVAGIGMAAAAGVVGGCSLTVTQRVVKTKRGEGAEASTTKEKSFNMEFKKK